MPPPHRPAPGMLLGYARESPGTTAGAPTAVPGLESQINELVANGAAAARVYSDRPGSGPHAARPGLDALLDYARAGDTVMVVSIDRLGRTADEVLATTRDLIDRKVGIRALREQMTTDDDAGSMVVGVLASLAVVNDEASRARQSSRRDGAHALPGRRGSNLGRPRALTDDQVALAHRMRAAGDPVPTIATALGVSRATLYRHLSDKNFSDKGAVR